MLAYRRAARAGRARALPVAGPAAARRPAAAAGAPAGADRPRHPAARAPPRPAPRPAAPVPPLRRRRRPLPPRRPAAGRGAGRGRGARARDPPRRLRAPRRGRAPRPTARPTLRARRAPPVVLCFGLMRPYKGLDVLLDAWGQGLDGAELWIVGMARMDTSGLRARAPASVRFDERFVADDELPACSPAPSSSCSPTARPRPPACCSRRSRSASRCWSATWAAPRAGRHRRRPRVPGRAGPRRCGRRCRSCSPTSPRRERMSHSADRRGPRPVLLAGRRPADGRPLRDAAGMTAGAAPR